jgi:hypothetical protein
MSTTFVCLDTNILYRYATQGQIGCEPEHWQELLDLIDTPKVKLLMPEVVVLEFEKLTINELDVLFADRMKGFEDSFTNLVKDTTHSKNGFFWNEAGDLVEGLAKHWSKLKKTKFAAFAARRDQIRDWLKTIKPLPLTETIMLATKKRMIADRYALLNEKKPNVENDCFIIDTLAAHFSGKLSGKELLLCTCNLPDFGVRTAEGKTTLHQAFAHGMPPAAIYTDLKSLVAAIKSGKPIAVPSPEEIEKAEEERAKQIAREQEAAHQWVPAPATYTVGQAAFTYSPYPAISYSPGFYYTTTPSGQLTLWGDDGQRQADDQKKLIDRRLEQQRRREQLP